MMLAELSDDDLLVRTEAVHFEGQRVLARLLVHLVEIENRRLELRRAYSSLFDFCRRKLGMSDSEAYRRITAARLVRRFPALVGFVERGETHLSILVLLKHELTADNFDELMAVTRGKTKRDVQTLLVARAPKPDVPSTIRELPAESPQPTLGLAGVAMPAPPPPEPPPRIEPLSPQRHLVQFTVSTETREKLERARDLLRHANPSGDLGEVVDRALTLLIAKLEKEKLAKAEKPRPARKAKKGSRHIPREIERQVRERDGNQCAFRGPDGERCPATTWLEIEHIVPFAHGGKATLENLCLLCRAHNQMRREQVFGEDFPRSKSPAPPEQVIIADTRVEAHRLDPESRAQALHGLVEMGFRQRDAAHALEQVESRHTKKRPLVLVDALREAIRILTP